MPAASFLQPSFYGGEWSAAYQGRADDPFYRKAMNVCLNGLPIEEGAWQRRGGTRLVSSTRGGRPAKQLQFNFSNNQSYMMEFTDGHLRFNNAQDLLLDAAPPAVIGVSSDNPALITAGSAHGWSNSDTVVFIPQPGDTLNVDALALVNRQFTIIVQSTTTFTIYDALTGLPFDGSTVTWVNNPGVVGRVTDIVTPYVANAWSTLRRVQNQNLVMLLNGAYMPHVVTATPPAAAAGPIFDLTEAVFQDGPYMDPVPSGTLLALSGSTLTLSYQTYSASTSYGQGDVVNYSGANYQSLLSGNEGNTPSGSPGEWSVVTDYPGVNGGAGFVSTDVGRLIRFYTQPADWVVGTTYAAGDYITYNDVQYQSLVGSNVGAEPDTSPNNWTVVVGNTQVAGWCWGQINTVTNTHTIVVAFRGGFFTNAALPCNEWQLGLYSETTGFPTCGCFSQGRFWLAGAQPNRVDATCSNGFPPAGAQGATAFNFAPTAFDGTVSDDNGLSLVFESDEADDISWMIPDHIGIVIGTAGGEWSLAASALGDPITPTSVQAHKVTKFKAANIEAQRTWQTFCFIQLHQRKLMEYFAGLYSSKYAGTNLSKAAKHLTGAGLAEIAYQQETTPVVWARDNNGQLLGCTYRRDNTYDANQDATFFGWHRHELGTGRTVLSIQTGPSPDGGQLDSLCMVTQDPNNGYCWIETLQRLFDEDVSDTSAWQVDGAAIPAIAVYTSPATLVLYGMALYAGKSVDITVGGLDLGSYTISSTGSISITMGTGDAALLTAAFLDSVSDTGTGSQTSVLYGAGPPEPAGTTTKTYLPANSDADDAGTFCIDYERRLAWGFVQYDGRGIGSSRLHLYNLDTQANLAQWDSGAYPGSVFNYNSGGTGIIDAATGDLIVFGVSQVNGASVLMRFHYNAGVITPICMCFLAGITANGHYPTSLYTKLTVGNYTSALALGIGSLQATMPVYLFDPNSGALLAEYNMSEKYGLVAPGEAGGSFGTAHTVGLPASPGSAGYIAAFYRHRYDGLGFSSEALGTITAPEINSGWSNSDSITVAGFTYDQTDGNLIGAFINATASATYLAKINIAGPAPFVQWTYLSTWAGSGKADYDFPQSNCVNGLVQFVEGSTRYTLSASSGVLASSASTSYSGLVSQRWDDNTGELYWRGTSNWNTNGLAAGATNLGFPGSPPWAVPICVGTTFTSQGQILRTIAPQEAGAQNGPALGKTRRTQMMAMLFRRSQGVSIGTDFAALHAIRFSSPGGTPYAVNVLFSGVKWDTLDDQYSFDSMVCWQVTRPYPVTIAAVEGFTQTQDRG